MRKVLVGDKRGKRRRREPIKRGEKEENKKRSGRDRESTTVKRRGKDVRAGMAQPARTAGGEKGAESETRGRPKQKEEIDRLWGEQGR